MSEETNVSRRSFVKRSIVGVSALGGAIGSSQSVAAASHDLIISGHGHYTVSVSGQITSQNSLESNDSAYDTHGLLVGTVDGDDDEITFDGHITKLQLSGEIDVWGTGDYPTTPNGDVEVSGDGLYAFSVTDDAQTTSDCESSESVEYAPVQGDGAYASGEVGTGDTDTFGVSGVIDNAATFRSDAHVTIDYQT